MKVGRIRPTNPIVGQQGFIYKLREQFFELRGFVIVGVVDDMGKPFLGIELPILPEVGNSLVEYLKFGRLKSEEPFVFLCARSPYNPIHTSVIAQIVRNSFAKTEINTKNRKHGPHALCHSLAGRLLERQTILPVISEVLGHENTESTRFYLRIDLTSLRQCVLDVPGVSSGFYAQKGGLFMIY